MLLASMRAFISKVARDRQKSLFDLIAINLLPVYFSFSSVGIVIYATAPQPSFLLSF